MKYEIKQKDVLLAVIDMDKQTIVVKNALCDWGEGIPALRSEVRDGTIYEVPCRIATGAKGWGLAIVEEAERQGYTIEEMGDIKDNADEGGEWKTVNGSPVFIKDGQSATEAIQDRTDAKPKMSKAELAFKHAQHVKAAERLIKRGKSQSRKMDSTQHSEHLKKVKAHLDAMKEIETSLKDNGGAGSGNFGHAGRPGERGGSGKGGSMQVGVTSARPGKTDDQVAKDFVGFKKMLGGVARNVETSIGRGGWEGGSESTFVTRYVGGDTAKAKLIAYARDTKPDRQDGILFMKPAGKDTEGATPITHYAFPKLDDADKTEIEQALVKNGFGGWTWSGSTLMLACIPAYGGTTKSHLEHAARFEKGLKGVSRVDRYAKIELISHEAYDSTIKSLKK